jgi:hypothetical protein
METKRTSLGLALASCVVFGSFICRTPQAVYCDPSCQLKALQQFMARESSSFNRMVICDSNDLARDTTEWFSWWPPGTQLVVYPLAAMGFSFGAALRLTVLGFIILGSVGWVLWFNLFNLPKWVQFGWAIFLPWMHFASNCAFIFSVEVMGFGLVPWMLWGTNSLSRAAQRREHDSIALIVGAAALGLSLGFVYMLRYAIVFTSLAAVLYLWTQLRPASFVSVLIGFVIPVGAMNIINFVASRDMNPVVLTAGLHLKVLSIPWIASLSALALTDGYSMLTYIFLHPVHGLLKEKWPILLIGLPGGIFLFTLIYHQRHSQGPTRLAIIHLAVPALLFLVIWNFSMVFDYHGRYLAVYSMSVLPVALQQGIVYWRKNTGILWRTALALAGFIYVLVPLLYGAVSVVAKVRRTPSNYAFGPSHIYNDLLAHQDLAGVRRDLLSDYHPNTDIWYLPDAISPLDIPGRAIIFSPDFAEIDELRTHHYRSSSPKRILMLLPPSFETNGKGPVIRQSFPQATVWTRREVTGCNYQLWVATLTL